MGYMHYTPSVTFLMQDIPEMVIWMDGSSTISSSLSENYKYFEPRWDPFQHILQMRSILKSCLDHGSSSFLMKMKNYFGWVALEMYNNTQTLGPKKLRNVYDMISGSFTHYQIYDYCVYNSNPYKGWNP